MKLICALPSPFARKIRILLAEKDIPFDVILEDVWSPDTHIGAQNPLGQVPCLVLDDGYTIYDSRVIAEYLEILAPLHIPTDPLARIETLKWSALAEGLLDAGVKIRVERMRPLELQSPAWIERQMVKINRGLAMIEERLTHHLWCANNFYSLADVSTVCLLGFLDFRMPEYNWRALYPNVDQLGQYLNAQPVYQATLPWAVS